MGHTPKISVVMPAYNSGKYIAAAIESILAQTFGDFEFIIINDGSTDNTADVVRKYDDARIVFVDNAENRGLVAVLNQGLDMARGEYIARMDSDDISYPTRFARQIAYMDANPDCGVLGTAGQNFGADDHVYYSPARVDMCELLRGVGFYHPSVMMRRDVLQKYNLRYDPACYLVEDHDLWARALMVTQLHNIQEVLIKYRVHSSSVSVSNSTRQEENKKHVRERLLNLVTDDRDLRDMIVRRACGTNAPPARVISLMGCVPVLWLRYKSVDNVTAWLWRIVPLLKVKKGRAYLFAFLPIATLRRA